MTQMTLIGSETVDYFLIRSVRSVSSVLSAVGIFIPAILEISL